jgi:hypothetical protein
MPPPAWRPSDGPDAPDGFDSHPPHLPSPTVSPPTQLVTKLADWRYATYTVPRIATLKRPHVGVDCARDSYSGGKRPPDWGD